VNIVPLDGQRSSGQIVASGKLPIGSMLETEQRGIEEQDKHHDRPECP
jgi:hypothetical protein